MSQKYLTIPRPCPGTVDMYFEILTEMYNTDISSNELCQHEDQCQFYR